MVAIMCDYSYNFPSDSAYASELSMHMYTQICMLVKQLLFSCDEVGGIARSVCAGGDRPSTKWRYTA